VVTPDALTGATPSTAAFADAAKRFPSRPANRFPLHVYARTSAAGGPDLRARMFSPLSGTVEDPATGSANAALGGLLATLAPGASTVLTLEILQGAEMGRPSMLTVTAEKRDGTVTRVRVGGRCVLVMEGRVTT
jgi:trans-2,3-dihydro-3-hydroxyanthranilate isomerase